MEVARPTAALLPWGQSCAHRHQRATLPQGSATTRRPLVTTDHQCDSISVWAQGWRSPRDTPPVLQQGQPCFWARTRGPGSVHPLSSADLDPRPSRRDQRKLPSCGGCTCPAPAPRGCAGRTRLPRSRREARPLPHRSQRSAEWKPARARALYGTICCCRRAASLAPYIGQVCHRISRGGSGAVSTTPAGETLCPILPPTPTTPTARIHVLPSLSPSSRERKTPQILLSPPQRLQNKWEETGATEPPACSGVLQEHPHPTNPPPTNPGGRGTPRHRRARQGEVLLGRGAGGRGAPSPLAGPVEPSAGSGGKDASAAIARHPLTPPG